MSLREDALEAQIDALLSSVTIDREVADLVLGMVLRWQRAQFAGDDRLLVRQQAAKAEAVRQMDALLTLKLRAMVSDELFQQKQAHLEGQIAALDQAVSQTEGELARARASALNAIRFMRGAREKFLVGSVYEKREIAQSLGIRYRFDRGQVTIAPHPALASYLLLELFESKSLRKPAMPLRSAIYSRKVRLGSLKPAPEGPKLHPLETRLTGSGSHKKAALSATFPFGGADDTRSETEQIKGAESDSADAAKRLYVFFRDCLPFRALRGECHN